MGQRPVRRRFEDPLALGQFPFLPPLATRDVILVEPLEEGGRGRVGRERRRGR